MGVCIEFLLKRTTPGAEDTEEGDFERFFALGDFVFFCLEVFSFYEGASDAG